MRCTSHFDAIRKRRDRTLIRDAWIERAIRTPLRKETQADGRLRCWIAIPEMGNRYLPVVLLADGETVHNAFFDRNSKP